VNGAAPVAATGHPSMGAAWAPGRDRWWPRHRSPRQRHRSDGDGTDCSALSLGRTGPLFASA